MRSSSGDDAGAVILHALGRMQGVGADLASEPDLLLLALDDGVDGVFLAPVIEDEAGTVVTLGRCHFFLCG